MKKATATVDALFRWYSGKDWKNDWQITNTMHVDNVHAQDRDYHGRKAAEYLIENETERVEVSSQPDGHGFWELEFRLKDKQYSMIASNPFGEEV